MSPGPADSSLPRRHPLRGRRHRRNPQTTPTRVTMAAGTAGQRGAPPTTNSPRDEPAHAGPTYSTGTVTGNIHAPTDLASTPHPVTDRVPTELYAERSGPDDQLFETYRGPGSDPGPLVLVIACDLDDGARQCRDDPVAAVLARGDEAQQGVDGVARGVRGRRPVARIRPEGPKFSVFFESPTAYHHLHWRRLVGGGYRTSSGRRARTSRLGGLLRTDPSAHPFPVRWSRARRHCVRRPGRMSGRWCRRAVRPTTRAATRHDYQSRNCDFLRLLITESVARQPHIEDLLVTLGIPRF